MRLSVILLSFFVLCFGLSASAQEPVRDSIRYYEKAIGNFYRRVTDSLVLHRDSIRYYNRQIERIKDRSKSYTAFMLFTEALSADFTTMNAAIAKDGFPPFSSSPDWRIGIGFSRKGYNGVVFDFGFAVLGLNRVVKNNNEKITASVSELFDMQLGYAVVNCRKFDVYPYAGLGLRFGSLSYDQPAVVNPNYNSIASIVTNDPSTTNSNRHLGYQAGLGIDWVIYENKKNHGGTMLFGKFGTSGIFGDETYSVGGIDYNTGIKYGVWAAQVGFKFFGR